MIRLSIIQQYWDCWIFNWLQFPSDLLRKLQIEYISICWMVRWKSKKVNLPLEKVPWGQYVRWFISCLAGLRLAQNGHTRRPGEKSSWPQPPQVHLTLATGNLLFQGGCLLWKEGLWNQERFFYTNVNSASSWFILCLLLRIGPYIWRKTLRKGCYKRIWKENTPGTFS